MHPPPAFAARAAQNKKAVVRPRDAGGAASCIKQRTPRSRSLKLGRSPGAALPPQMHSFSRQPSLRAPSATGHRPRCRSRCTRSQASTHQGKHAGLSARFREAWHVGWHVRPRSTASPALIFREAPDRTIIHRAITALPGKLACIPCALTPAHARAHMEDHGHGHGYGQAISGAYM